MRESLPFTAPAWRQHKREAATLGALALACAAVAAGSAWSSPGTSEIAAARAERTAPAPPPLLVRNIAPTEAEALNGRIPLASEPNPSAPAFSTAGLSAASRAQALECLTQAAYYEAGNESEDGLRAVVQVVLNRVRHPAFPSSICGVVYQGSTRATGCQFTFTCDGSLQRQPDPHKWARAKRIAESALNGAVYAPVGLATHYHAYYVIPYWAATLAKNAVVGAHLFYRWAGGWGRPAAFVQAYSRSEPSASALKAGALAAFASRPALASANKIADIPGAEIEKAQPGRVAVRFKLDQARKAVEDAPRIAYVEKVAASDNLRWTLSGGSPGETDQKPLGRPADNSPAN